MSKSKLGLSAMLTGILCVAGISTTKAQSVRTNNRSTNSQSAQKQETQKRQTTSGNQDSELFTFTGPDDDFSVKTPVKLTLVSSKPNELTSSRLYGGFNDEVTISVILQEMGLASDNPYNNEFGPDYERITAKGIRKLGFNVISFRRVAPNIVDWEQWHPGQKSGDWTHMLQRHIVNNGRLYTLSCSSQITNQEINRDLCKSYFKSFKLLN